MASNATKTTINVEFPRINELCEVIVPARQEKTALENASKEKTAELGELLVEFDADIIQTDSFIINVVNVNRTGAIDRVLLLEQGVKPAVIDKATKEGSSYTTYQIKRREK
jgi:hypothetical protein